MLVLKILIVIWLLLLIIKILTKRYIQNDIFELINWHLTNDITIPSLLYIISSLLSLILGFIVIVVAIFTIWR